MSQDRINYFKAAFLWQYNVILLAAAFAFAVISQSALPLLLAAGLELMYLSTVPNNERFRRLVRSRAYEEQRRVKAQELNAMFRALPRPFQARFDELGVTCRAIKSNYHALSASSQMIAEPLEKRLDQIMEGYVRMLNAAQLQRDYLANTNPADIDRELAKLKTEPSGAPAKVKEINERRIEILMKRLEKFQKIRENRDVLDAQLAATEDVLKLIRDQSVTMRDPQQVADQLETLVHDVEQTEETVKEMESIFELAVVDPDVDSRLPGSGSRLRS
jgi:hypothetical protein